METTRRLLQGTLETFGKKAPKAMEILEEGFENTMQILSLPLPLRKRLRTSNSIERLNQEIRRRERVIRIFPNRESLQRLMGALLMDIHEGWLTGKRYLSPASIQEALNPVETAQSAGYPAGSEVAA
jgi:transposase-like protein